MRRSWLGLFLLPTLALGNTISVDAGVVARPNDVTAVQPARVLDTRIGLGASVGLLREGVDLHVRVPAAAGATSVILNITATDATVDGWIKAWPCDEQRPQTSSLNFTPGSAVANSAVVRVFAGTVCFGSSAPVHLVADVSGWYTGSDDFVASSPNRLLDTRVTGDPMSAGRERRIKVAGTPGISGSAQIAALNITVDRPARAGWVVAYPCGQPTNGSTVNFSAGEIVANFTLVGLTAGDVCIKSLVDVQLIVDSFGWSAGAGRLAVQSPSRLLDTRDTGTWDFGPAQSGDTISLRVAGRAGVPNTADAALVTVTVANPSGFGYVTVWPCDQPFPTASTVNTFPNALRSNLAFVKLSVTEGEACLRYVSSNKTPTDLIVDAVGWFTGTVSRQPPTDVGTLPCRLAAAAFCDTFDSPAGGGTRTGDLSPVLWGVSRVGGADQNDFDTVAGVSLSGCGSTALSFPPNDVRICNGQMFEAVNDGGGAANLNTYPKQPFNFANRTGKVTFDVSADSDGSHAAWPEFVITDKPVPGVRSFISIEPAGAANSVGFALDGGCGQNGMTGVGVVFVTKAYVYSQPAFTTPNCVTKGSPTALNHFEVRVSQNRLEVWGTDAGKSTLKQLAVADNLGLTLTQGLVWLNDVHYNARKAIEPCECGTQFNHTFVWDNLGFDGPKTYRDLGFDVPDSNTPGGLSIHGDPGNNTGFHVGNGVTLTVPGVRRDQTPTGAQVVLNTYTLTAAVVPSISINGGPWIDTPWPYTPQVNSWRSLSIPIPLDQVHDGTNTISFKSGDASAVIANISIILVAASAVP